ncbi:JAB domain-containing protein [Halomonas neptunia]|nr:JAB domain-containing protein [Halomonas neptunia]MDN3562656.1 JAB domain-containing protein [Halomonas neptunia]
MGGVNKCLSTKSSACSFDSRHRVIHFEEPFRGTIDAASVYPRQVLKATLPSTLPSLCKFTITRALILNP